MIGDKIKELRRESDMTQKELADKLYVTAQAVSRWENGEVEPSVTTIAQIAKIFGVSTDTILGIENPNKEVEVVEKVQYVYEEPQKPVLAVCEKCNKPLYDADEIVRESHNNYSMRRVTGTTTRVLCATCKRKETEQYHNTQVQNGISRRKKSFWLGGLAAAVMIIIGIIVLNSGNTMPGIYCMLGAIPAFTLVACLLLQNNFICDVVGGILVWGVVKFPGIIFTFDIDGCLFLIGMKILFAILGFLIGLSVGILAIVVGGTLSLFVYPFAIAKNFSDPTYEN